MVFPWCYEGCQQIIPDVSKLGAQLLDHFIYTGSRRQGDASYNAPDPAEKIRPNIFILDHLQPVGENDFGVRAGRIRRLNMG